jgi:hypothetical protein
LGAALLIMAAGYSLRMPRGVPVARAEEPSQAPVGEQQVGGPESDEPTTKQLS